MSSPALTSPGTGIDEDRAGVLTSRLVLPPPPHDLGDLRLGGGTVAGADTHRHLDDDVVRR